MTNDAMATPRHEASSALLTLPSGSFRHKSFSMIILNVSELQSSRYQDSCILIHLRVMPSIWPITRAKEGCRQQRCRDHGDRQRIADHVFVLKQIVVEEAWQERSQHQAANVDGEEQQRRYLSSHLVGKDQ